MGAFRKTLQALTGLISAAALAAAVSTLAFPAENDLLFSAGPVRIGVTGAGAGLGLLTVLAFAGCWISVRRKSAGDEKHAGVLNAAGFGLLPGLAVWKCFEQYTVSGKGTRIPEGIISLPWITEDGICMPCRLEIILALMLFCALILWLTLRRKALPENGDVFGTAAAAWCASRLVTDGYHAEQLPWLGQSRITGWLFAGLMFAVLAAWTGRAFRQKKNTGYAFACVPVFAASVTLTALLRNGIILKDNPPAVLVLMICSALLSLKAVLCMGRVSRQIP